MGISTTELAKFGTLSECNRLRVSIGLFSWTVTYNRKEPSSFIMRACKPVWQCLMRKVWKLSMCLGAPVQSTSDWTGNFQVLLGQRLASQRAALNGPLKYKVCA